MKNTDEKKIMTLGNVTTYAIVIYFSKILGVFRFFSNFRKSNFNEMNIP